MSIQAVIFDLDGVIVSTDDCHYQGWKRMADDEGIYFDRTINERLRGVSRMESLAIVLERANKTYSDEDKVALAERKNGYYRDLIQQLTPADILPGISGVLTELRARGIKMAIGSSSKNCPIILERIGLADAFDAVVDGNQISRSKPDPEVFSLAAQRLSIAPQQCLVVEDAEAGVEAGIAAGMAVLGVGSASTYARATIMAADFMAISVEQLLAADAVSVG